MTLIVLLQPRRFLLYFHVCSFYSSSPEGLCQISRCGSFLPSYPLSSFGVVPGSCVSSIIPSSWNIGICGHEPRLTDGCSAREMEPIHRARKAGSGANPNSSRWSRQSRSPFGLPSQREPVWLNQIPIGFRFHLFFYSGRGLWII